MRKRTVKVVFSFLLSVFVLSAFGFAQETSTVEHGFDIVRDANVPDLPFEDNPDPTLCGIPEPWSEDGPAYLSGFYEGELIQEDVLLYDSHLRRSVVGSAVTGSEIKILLFQSNPSLNYYLVRTVGEDNVQEGWIPAPFVVFDDAS